MKKEQVLIIVAVIAAILLVSNLMSLGKINKLNSEVASLNKVVRESDASIRYLTDQVQAKQLEIDAAEKALNSLEIKVTTLKPASAMPKK
jgi:outer membrane murein-binding lipoprotein Lpp